MNSTSHRVLQRCLDDLNGGDDRARERLLTHALDRLEGLAGRMLQEFPGVARWEQPEDVLQNALLRLWKALEGRAVPAVRDFFGLAAEIIRRELIDLARRHLGPEG